MVAGGFGSIFPTKEELEKAEQIWNWRWQQYSTWEKSFALLPHRCHLSKKWIWMRMGYRGTLLSPDIGNRLTLSRWHHYDEHIIWELKR